MSEKLYFNFDASLRVFGQIDDLSEIFRIVGIEPTHSHKKGEKRTEISAPYEHDMWIYTPPIEGIEKLSVHLDTLWGVIRPNIDEIKKLKEKYTVNILCGYRSNSDTAGFNVDYKSLKIFEELEVPFDVSVIIA